jgi:hypothetical protein
MRLGVSNYSESEGWWGLHRSFLERWGWQGHCCLCHGNSPSHFCTWHHWYFHVHVIWLWQKCCQLNPGTSTLQCKILNGVGWQAAHRTLLSLYLDHMGALGFEMQCLVGSEEPVAVLKGSHACLL